MNDVILPDFVRDLLSDLHTRFGLDGWALTRTVETDALIIFAVGHGVAEGASQPLVGSVHAQIAERGVLIAADLRADEDLVAPIPDAAGFAGTVVHADGAAFGALFGVGVAPLDCDHDEMRAALSVAARAVGLVLSTDQAATPPPPVAPRGDQRRDPLTGLLNQRGWDDAVSIEQERCRRYGNHATVVRLRVHGLAGEEPTGAPPSEVVLRQTGDALRTWRRGADVVARVGTHDFAALLVEVWADEAAPAVDRLRQTLDTRRIEAETGVADNQAASLVEASELAANLLL